MVFNRISGEWSQQGNKLLGGGAIGAISFGESVSISADGNTAIVGGYRDNSFQGAAWVYTRSGNNWSQQGNKLVGTGGIGNTVYQGYSVSLSADGNIALVGGRGDNSSIGATWIFTRTGITWKQQGSKLIGTGGNGLISQGSSVSLSADGNTSIVGGPLDNSIGASWIFTATNSSNLSNLILNNGSLSPSFNKDSTAYASIVNNTTSSLTIKPFKEDSFATLLIKINNGSYVNINSGTNSSPLFINVGSNTVYISVTAPDGVTTKIYTIVINRLPSNNANLSNVNLIGANYTPTFNSNILTYSSSVLYGVNSVKAAASLADTSARIQLKINEGAYSSINNKDTSAYLPINVGINTISIKVNAQDTTVSKVYTFTIIRANAIAPSAMSYSPNSVVATNGITNINSIPSYSGDSITSFSVAPAFPSGISLNTSSGLISGIPNVVSAQTLYTITGSNTGGSTNATFTLIVNKGTGINETELVSTAIYPNPTTGVVNISSSQAIDNIEVFDITGKLVLSHRNDTHQKHIELDLSAFGNGIYFIAVQSINGEISKSKIVLAK